MGAPAGVRFPIWSMTVTLWVTEPELLGAARGLLNVELASVDQACNRFRADSELNAVNAAAGCETQLSPVLNTLVTAAIRVAAATNHLVDPTVTVAALGYDRDISQINGGAAVLARGLPAPGAWRIRHSPATGRMLMPRGVGLDLGATAKALAADRAAEQIAQVLGCGVLVDIGGDIAVAGTAPDGGWQIGIADDHRSAAADPQTTVSITSGGLATSSTALRRWRGPSGDLHHIVDPRTGRNPNPLWRTVSVAAASCLGANAASTAAIVLGTEAPGWLDARGLPARLTGEDGRVVLTAGWPVGPVRDDSDAPAEGEREDEREAVLVAAGW